MFKLNIFKTALFVTLLISFASCQEEIALAPRAAKEILSRETLEENRIEFSIVLAKSLEKQEFRNFLRSESLKEFDMDTEILYQMIKDVKYDGSSTVEQYLSSNAPSPEEFERITNSLPLLTIGIPHLPVFSAGKWNTETTVPLVAALETNDGKPKKKYLRAFDKDGKESSLVRNNYPTVPVIVIKDNERIQLVPKQQHLTDNQVMVHQNDEFYFAFWDGSFDKRKYTLPKHRGGFYNSYDSRVQFAFENNLNYHRDYVYYGIAPELGVNTGPYNMNYGEFITGMAFKSNNNASYIYDDPATDWSDGNFEFSVQIFFINDKTSVGNISKGFSVAFGELFDYYISNNQINITDRRWYLLPGNGIFINTWQMDKHGDTWKFSTFEQDAQTNQTYSASIQISSSYGTNFTNGSKDGANFGSTSNNGINYTQGYQLVITGGPDQLYDGLLKWQDKILLSKIVGFGVEIGTSYTMDTGTITLSVEPKHRYN
jgi:hypothetical protein